MRRDSEGEEVSLKGVKRKGLLVRDREGILVRGAETEGVNAFKMWRVLICGLPPALMRLTPRSEVRSSGSGVDT